MAVYIEKQAAIEKLCHVDEYNSRSVAAIKEMKPADVRPVIRGRWIKLYENPLDGNFYCSNCKEVIDIADGEDTPLKRGLYYCHNCGADMRKQEEKPKKDPFEGWSEELKETYRKLLASLHLEGGDAE